jgi:glutamate-1-semialdehyde 2,1-aminomutase
MEDMVNIVAIVQARVGSTRLPGKVLKPILGIPMIELLINRLKKSKLLDEIIVATSNEASNIPLVDIARRLGLGIYSGSEIDVLDRYYKAAKEFDADVVVRITGDCPLIDPEIVDLVISKFLASHPDYASNTLEPTFPDGLDVEVFSFNALAHAWTEASHSYDREHVTPYIKNSNSFLRLNINSDEDFSGFRWTVDEREDFFLVEKIYEYFSPNIYFGWNDVLELQKIKPELFSINTRFKRNEGSLMSTGQKLWNRAKNVIPGGNMLLSKRPEMFLPQYWPVYFSRAKGCKVWDLDEVEYLDLSIMGIGTNILGYGDERVDNAVKQVVNMGNMSTLNCPEEVYLAEKLVELHPWADMVRFARSGGEANAIAVRIGRAASGRDNIAICGYHGWHDWYLAANLVGEGELAQHLLPDLEPNGVPKALKGTVFPFKYNNFEELENIVKNNNIGVIKMEVMRNFEPIDGFLEKVRKIATDNNIVLIFDECTSGFRETNGGLHKKYKVNPDIAMFGKAIGNGYAITAIIGRREIMEAAQSTFISSTFWTERIGPVAALKTLEVMKDCASWEVITAKGRMVKKRWGELADFYGLKICQWGIPALAGFSFENKPLHYKTLITQEMLKKGYLASNCLYMSIAHSDSILDQYFENLSQVFKLIKECEDGRSVEDLLQGDICHGGFRRLN